jgi:hypothetical protein
MRCLRAAATGVVTTSSVGSRPRRLVTACVSPAPDRGKRRMPKPKDVKKQKPSPSSTNDSEQLPAGREESGRGFSERERHKRLERVLESYGFEKDRPGQEMDRLCARADAEDEPLSVRLYSGIRALFGGRDETLFAAEQWLNRLVLSFLALVLTAGLGIVLEATAASQHWPLPLRLAGFLRDQVEPSFTPLLLIFLGMSSLLGIYKAVQIEGDERARYRE